MQIASDVNPAFAAWRSSTESQKECALRTLIQRLEKFATAICWQRLPDHRDEFQALTNVVVWRALKKADDFRDESQFSTWFYKIAVNECNRFLRSYLRRCETSLEEMAIRSDLDARIDLISLLDGLTGSDHLLFRLVAEGQDFKAVGKALGISQKTAIVRWSRLKEKLRDARQ